MALSDIWFATHASGDFALYEYHVVNGSILDTGKHDVPGHRLNMCCSLSCHEGTLGV